MSSRPAVVRLSRVASLSWDDCRLLVESVSDYAIFMLDPGGRVSTWNIGAERIKGYRAEEIVGEHFSKFYPAEDVAAGKPEMELEIARELGRVEDEGWRLRKDGSHFWGNVVITALRDEEGNLRGFAKVTRDLTERRAAEEELRLSEERFRLLVESVGDYAIFMLDPEGRVATWNLGAERLKGYRADEILEKDFVVFFPEEDAAAGKPARELTIARAEGRFEDEGLRVRKDGTHFWAHVVVTAMRDGHGRLVGFSKVTRDLTARRAAEETERNLLREQVARATAEAMAREAEEANRTKDEFLATVSHELRTPLNAIVGWASLLRQRQLEPGVAKGLEVIERNARAQAKIVDDILDVSRIVTGKLRLDARPMDLAAVTKDAIEALRPSASAKQITLELGLPKGACLIVGDPERLRQVAWNLLSNAVKFTETGGSIRVSLREEASSVVLAVSDTGSGIPSEFLPFVFDRFTQADASTTRRFGGLGLGLALVRHIAELHGGTVFAESDGPGKGATFRLVLPAPVRARRARSPSPPRGTRAAARSSLALRDLRVLVVDDEADVRDLMTTILVQAGAEVETASSAAEGIEALRIFRPHVLVSDIGMIEEDGYSFVRRVQALDPDEGGGIPSIALTAYTRSEDRTRALLAGFSTHVGKPVVPDDIVAAIANLAGLVQRRG